MTAASNIQLYQNKNILQGDDYKDNFKKKGKKRHLCIFPNTQILTCWIQQIIYHLVSRLKI